MKGLKTILLLLVMSTAIVSTINAQGCGGSSSCHSKSGIFAQYGGTVKQVGKYNIEMVYQPVMKQEPLIFYLMNKRGKPISNTGIPGKAELRYADGSTGTLALESRGENGFAGQMVNKTGSFICLLTLTINGKNVAARFDGGTHPTQATYICSMHPEEQSDKPGNCPKCGMALDKK